MTGTLLNCIEVEARGPATASVIWLHGLGASGHDFEPVVPHLQLSHARFVFPNAPAIPITINGGFVMPGWYDLRSLELGPTVKDREDPTQIRQSAAAVEALIAREVERGVPHDRIILAGFSQGGAMALYVAPRHAHKLAGFMVLSAYQLLVGSGGEHEANATTPALFCHGRNDSMVPMFAGKAACESVRRPGRDVRWHEFPIGHEVSMPEIQTIGAWLRERLPPT